MIIVTIVIAFSHIEKYIRRFFYAALIRFGMRFGCGVVVVAHERMLNASLVISSKPVT